MLIARTEGKKDFMNTLSSRDEFLELLANSITQLTGKPDGGHILYQFLIKILISIIRSFPMRF